MQEKIEIQGENQQPSQNQKQKIEKISQNEKLVESQQESLRKQLLAMQFQAHLVDKALLHTKDIEKAVQYIIAILQEQDIQDILKGDTIELVLLVRMDLKMGTGKIAAQCAHAILKSFQIARDLASTDDHYLPIFLQWLESGKQKVFYKVETQKQLVGLLEKCKGLGASTCHIRDAGRTQIAAGSMTVGAVGPFSSKSMELITKKLTPL